MINIFKKCLFFCVHFKENWEGEFDLILFNRRTAVRWLSPKIWFSWKWIFSLRKSYHGDTKDQILFGIRALGWDYCFIIFKLKTGKWGR